MRVKLLKKLRKKYVIEQRGNEYRVNNIDDIFGVTVWTKSLFTTRITRREYILNYARRNYKTAKKLL